MMIDNGSEDPVLPGMEEETVPEDEGDDRGGGQPIPEKKRRSRVPRLYPAATFEEALDFAKSLLDFGSGKPARRVQLFDHLKKSPDSGPSRQLITNANKYGLTSGSYTSEFLQLTEVGQIAANDETPPKEQARARIKLAIESIAVFKGMYDKYVGNKLPAKATLIDSATEFGVDTSSAEEAADTFILNLRFLKLLQTLSGAERIVSVDTVIDQLPGGYAQPIPLVSTANDVRGETTPSQKNLPANDVCFFIAPIGADDSIERKHSDLVLGSIIEPALEQFKLQVVRADAIASPGVIGKQIIDHIINAKLVVVDLSFHNPNVFYELAIRHMLRRPIVQLIRKSDKIPFDISQVRTVIIDMTDIYTLVPKIETYKADIANQVRRALEDADAADNPISMFFPTLKVVEQK